MFLLEQTAGASRYLVDYGVGQLTRQYLIMDADLIAVVDRKFLSPQRHGPIDYIIDLLGTRSAMGRKPESTIVHKIPVVGRRNDEGQSVRTCEQIAVDRK